MHGIPPTHPIPPPLSHPAADVVASRMRRLQHNLRTPCSTLLTDGLGPRTPGTRGNEKMSSPCDVWLPNDGRGGMYFKRAVCRRQTARKQSATQGHDNAAAELNVSLLRCLLLPVCRGIVCWGGGRTGKNLAPESSCAAHPAVLTSSSSCAHRGPAALPSSSSKVSCAWLLSLASIVESKISCCCVLLSRVCKLALRSGCGRNGKLKGGRCVELSAETPRMGRNDTSSDAPSSITWSDARFAVAHAS